MVVNTNRLTKKSRVVASVLVRVRALVIGALVAGSANICACLPSHAQTKSTPSPDVVKHLWEGDRQMKSGNLDRAKAEYQAAVDADPNCAAAHNNVGLVYMHSGDFDKAEEEFKKALAIDALFLPSLSNLGQIHYAKGSYDDAILCYRQALQLAGGNDADVHVNLANALRDKREFKDAMEHYKKALEMNPSEAIAYNGLAKMYYVMGRCDLAAQEAKKAIHFKPDYAMAYYHLGLAEAAQQHMSKAIEAYELSLKYETNPSYATETKRLINEAKQPHVAVVAPSTSSTPAEKIDASDAEFDKINGFISKGQYLRAQKDLDDLTSGKGADDPVLWNNLGFVRMNLGHYPEAVEAYKKSADLSGGKYARAEYNMAQTYRLLGDNGQAYDACKRAVDDARASGKPYPEAQDLLGILLKDRGDLKGAEAAYKLAISQAGNDLPVAHYNLALVLEKEGDQSRDAAQHYKRYLDLAPHGKNAKQARRRLRILGYQ